MILNTGTLQLNWKGTLVLRSSLPGLHEKENDMEGEIIISLVIFIVIAIIVLKFVARVFLKIIFLLILAVLALYIIISGGLPG